MKISETTLPFLKNDCLQIFGQETGTAIFQRTETIYRELLQNTEQPKSDAVKEHMQRKLFPPWHTIKRCARRERSGQSSGIRQKRDPSSCGR